ncbi:hypothetical protein Kim5_PA00492 (plasmid) [Rhizobium sp. Kim5]|nr:hypothetical protein Kim5_PA00492 [Rhizobium sp. Kim5]
MTSGLTPSAGGLCMAALVERGSDDERSGGLRSVRFMNRHHADCFLPLVTRDQQTPCQLLRRAKKMIFVYRWAG